MSPVCLAVFTCSWVWSFATASRLSGRFLILLKPPVLVCLRAGKLSQALFLRECGLHSGHIRGEDEKTFLNTSAPAFENEPKAVDRGGSTNQLRDVAHEAFLPCNNIKVCAPVPEINVFFFCYCAFVVLPDGPVIWRMLTYPPTRRALLVGCGLHMFQQVSGINTIM